LSSKNEKKKEEIHLTAEYATGKNCPSKGQAIYQLYKISTVIMKM
jgi:hypothetical protein